MFQTKEYLNIYLYNIIIYCWICKNTYKIWEISERVECLCLSCFTKNIRLIYIVNQIFKYAKRALRIHIHKYYIIYIHSLFLIFDSSLLNNLHLKKLLIKFFFFNLNKHIPMLASMYVCLKILELIYLQYFCIYLVVELCHKFHKKNKLFSIDSLYNLMQITNSWKEIKNLALAGIIESINFLANSFVNSRTLVNWDNVWLKSIFIYLINSLTIFQKKLSRTTSSFLYILYIYERFHKYLDTFLTLKYVLAQKKSKY